MHHFSYKNGVLHAEDVNLKTLAEEVGTPFYCYSTATLERHFKVLDEAFKDTEHLICYAMKANSNQAVIKTMAKLGAIAPRFGCGCSSAKNCIFRCWQNRQGNGFCAARRHCVFQR